MFQSITKEGTYCSLNGMAVLFYLVDLLGEWTINCELIYNLGIK